MTTKYTKPTSEQLRKQNSGTPVIIAVVIIIAALAIWSIKWWLIWKFLKLIGVNPPAWMKFHIEINN